MGQAVVPAERLEFEAFASVCEIHPELLDRLASLGLVEVFIDDDGNRWLERRQVAVLARVRRLRSGLGLGYSSIAVVADLIDRIDELEERLRWFEAHTRRNPQPHDHR